MLRHSPIHIRGLLVGLVVILAVPCFCRGASPENTFTLRVKGAAAGVGLTARKAALEQAEREAVTEALQSMTGSSDLTAYAPVLGQASRYMLRTDILRAEVVGQTTEVEIDAVLLEKSLRYDVATIMFPRLPRKPTVRLLIADFIGPTARSGGPTFDVAEAVFHKRLSEFGFEVKGIHDLLDQYEADLLADLTSEADWKSASAFARGCIEDVVIVGAASTTHDPLAPNSNMLRNRAEVTLRVFSGPDGKMHDTLCAQAVVQSVNPEEGGVQATQDACGKLAGECIVAVILANAGMNDQERVLITVEHPGDQETVQALCKIAASIAGVSAVNTLFFSPSKARVGAVFSGSMAIFSDNLAGLKLKEKRVEVVRCVGREVTLQLH